MLSWQTLFCFLSSRLHHCSIICRTSPYLGNFSPDLLPRLCLWTPMEDFHPQSPWSRSQILVPPVVVRHWSHMTYAGYAVNDLGDVKFDQFLDDPTTASNVRRPRAVGAANKKVRACLLKVAVVECGPVHLPKWTAPISAAPTGSSQFWAYRELVHISSVLSHGYVKLL